MDEEFESLCPFCIIQKKGTGENPDTFPGAEGETRRVFNPSCSLCEQFILCPFLLRKKMDEEFESLQTNSYIQKEKAQRKNPCAFSGAEGETRTLAPVTRPTPLAGAPRHQLEYFCIGSVYDTIRLLKERAENPLSLLSGGESGIRTHGTLPYDGFQDRSVITTSVSLRIRRKLWYHSFRFVSMFFCFITSFRKKIYTVKSQIQKYLRNELLHFASLKFTGGQHLFLA